MAAHQRPEAAKTTAKAKAKKEQEAREGEYMAGESNNVLELTTIYATKAQAMRAAQAKWDKIQRGVGEFSITFANGRALYRIAGSSSTSGTLPNIIRATANELAVGNTCIIAGVVSKSLIEKEILSS